MGVKERGGGEQEGQTLERTGPRVVVARMRVDILWTRVSSAGRTPGRVTSGFYAPTERDTRIDESLKGSSFDFFFGQRGVDMKGNRDREEGGRRGVDGPLYLKVSQLLSNWEKERERQRAETRKGENENDIKAFEQ